jgi:hypothetical protein
MGPGRNSATTAGHVLELLRLQAAQQVAHAARFQLEDADRLRAAEQVERRAVVQREVRHVDRDAVVALDETRGLVEHGHRAQPEEVHLEEPGLLARAHVPLRRDFVLVRAEHRHVIGQRPGRDQDAGGVHRRVARHALEPARAADQLAVLVVAGGQRLEVPDALDRLVERDAELVRHELRDAVALGERHPEHARDVADHRLRLHAAERDDLAHRARAVLGAHVLDHLAAAGVLEVEVDVGHRHALGIEETLEDEPVLDRVDVGDAQAVGDQRPRHRAAARPDADLLAARVMDEVAHDQEVRGEAELRDHAELVLEPLPELGRHLPVAIGQPGFREPAEERFGRRLPLRQREDRQLVLVFEVEVAEVGDRARLRQRGRQLAAEQPPHLLLRLEEHLLALVTQALRIVDRLPVPDREQHVVRLGIARVQVVEVVRHHERDPRRLRHVDHAAAGGELVGDVVVLHLEEEVALAEDVAVDARGALGVLDLLLEERLVDLALEARGEPDQAFVAFGQNVPVDARLVVEAVDERGRRELDQVPVPGEILREEDHVEVALAARAILARAGRDVRLHPEDRLDPRLLRLLVELDRPEQVAVVGERERGHAELGRALDHRVDLARAVEQAVVGVPVEVDEVGSSLSHDGPNLPPMERSMLRDCRGGPRPRRAARDGPPRCAHVAAR